VSTLQGMGTPAKKLRYLLTFLAASACAALWAYQRPARASAGRGPEAWAPDGLVRMEVRDVVPLPEVNAHAVVLVSTAGDTLVPLFVDPETALSVALRLAHQRPPGPLAPELLSGVLDKVGGKITALRVDGLERNEYTGRVRVEQGGRAFDLAARPTDALALALESDAPVYASRKMVQESGITREEIEQLKDQLPPGRPGGAFPTPPHRHPGSGEDREL
jgi:bifunctional DNase/RNase